jgi:hypothetical protein
MNPRFRTYTTYSIGLAVVWAVILIGVHAKGNSDKFHTFLLIFLGYGIGWTSGTVARFVYPPPKRWHRTG